mmetsp:Transcript_132959/g.384426  ORF Transcript_132959/g.384426 Transcript_132959/m.384426 type:complete len:259 (+) Transcript_132959:148-924(+)
MKSSHLLICFGLERHFRKLLPELWVPEPANAILERVVREHDQRREDQFCVAHDSERVHHALHPRRVLQEGDIDCQLEVSARHLRIACFCRIKEPTLLGSLPPIVHQARAIGQAAVVLAPHVIDLAWKRHGYYYRIVVEEGSVLIRNQGARQITGYKRIVDRVRKPIVPALLESALEPGGVANIEVLPVGICSINDPPPSSLPITAESNRRANECAGAVFPCMRSVGCVLAHHLIDDFVVEPPVVQRERCDERSLADHD